MMIEFAKMNGAGNDFVVLDNRDGKYDHFGETVISSLCERKRGIGADGLIMLHEEEGVDFVMKYFNRDGREVEMCANGARCAILFAHELSPDKNSFLFKSASGLHTGNLVQMDEKVLVEIDMPSPTGMVLGDKISIGKKEVTFDFIIIGVPHVVIVSEVLPETSNVAEIGRIIRYHNRFRPGGTNVNFATVKTGDTIELRTYERGVEEETLACGTGSTAASILTTVRGLTHSPVRCLTRGGDVLVVEFDYEPGENRISGLTLRGEAQIIYHGTLCRRA